MGIKIIFLFFVFGLLFVSPLAIPLNALQSDQVPFPPTIPQPEPEPDPIGPKDPEPIEEPFPGLTDKEKIQKLTEENEKLKSENAKLKTETETSKIQKNFLQGQIEELKIQLADRKAVILEQIKVILFLVEQAKNAILDNFFSPNVSV
jgi:hypothetical protein